MSRRLSAGIWPYGLRAAGSRKQGDVQSFTLVELMIVLSILTLLVSVAFPSYQKARNHALISTMVDELLSYARACALINSSGVGATPVLPAVTADRGGVEITEGCTGQNEGATLQASWGTAKAAGVDCREAQSEATSATARITISPQGVLTCSFQN